MANGLAPLSCYAFCIGCVPSFRYSPYIHYALCYSPRATQYCDLLYSSCPLRSLYPLRSSCVLRSSYLLRFLCLLYSVCLLCLVFAALLAAYTMSMCFAVLNFLLISGGCGSQLLANLLIQPCGILSTLCPLRSLCDVVTKAIASLRRMLL